MLQRRTGNPIDSRCPTSLSAGCLRSALESTHIVQSACSTEPLAIGTSDRRSPLRTRCLGSDSAKVLFAAGSRVGLPPTAGREYRLPL